MPKVMRHCKKFRDVHFDPDAFATTDAFILKVNYLNQIALQ